MDDLRSKIERLLGTAILKNDKNYTDDFMAAFQAFHDAALRRQDVALRWLLSDDTGTSSKTLCAHMLGIDTLRYQSPPSDRADRGRCIRLLQLIPEWQARLDELATYGGQS